MASRFRPVDLGRQRHDSAHVWRTRSRAAEARKGAPGRLREDNDEIVRAAHDSAMRIAASNGTNESKRTVPGRLRRAPREPLASID